VFRLIAKLAGVRFAYSLVPWKRALKQIETGHSDAVFNASFSKSRAVYGAYPMKGRKPDESRILKRYGYLLYTRSDTSLKWDGTQFNKENFYISVKLGDSIAENLTSIAPSAKQIEVGSYEQVLAMVAIGRVDAAAVIAARKFDDITKLGAGATRLPAPDGVVKNPVALKEKVGYLMFSKKLYSENAELVERIWDTLPDVRKTAEFLAIKKKYQ
jgi:ABC-type amino acid transport substrate-binding protein